MIDGNSLSHHYQVVQVAWITGTNLDLSDYQLTSAKGQAQGRSKVSISSTENDYEIQI